MRADSVHSPLASHQPRRVHPLRRTAEPIATHSFRANETAGLQSPPRIHQEQSVCSFWGFVPIDDAQAGLYGDSKWIRTACEVRYPPCEYDLLGPPLTYFDDFEETTGRCDVRKRARARGRPAGAMAVTAESAATGRRCLKITDAPNLESSHDPHFDYVPRLIRGRATLAFDICIDQGAQLSCEWREYPGVPYFHTGPRIAIREAMLTAPDIQPLPVPVGQWFRV